MARLWAVTGVLIISFSAIFVRLAGVSPTTSAFFRCLYALPLLVVLWLLQRGSSRRPPRDRWLAVAAGIFLGLDLAFWHRAIDLIGAGLATVLGNTQVVFVGLLAWLLHGERPTRRALAAVPVVFAGVVLISGVGADRAYGVDPRLGVFFGLLTGITYAIFLLGYRASGRGLGSPVGPLLDATIGAILGTLVVGAVDRQIDFAVTWPAHGWLLALAVGSQVIGWQLIGAALPRLPALETSVYLLLQPMLTALWAWLLFAERLAPAQLAGMSLVLTGVGWMSMSGSVTPPAEEPTGD
ncbi:MAG: DMT family transporter [Acidobacteriota bacterium]